MSELSQQVSCYQCPHKCRYIGNLSHSEVEFLNENKREVNYKKGETIVKQHTFVSHVIFVRKGLVKFYIEGTNGKNIIVHFTKANEFIGLSSLQGNNQHNFSAVALKATGVCLIEKSAINLLVDSNPSYARGVIDWYSSNYTMLLNKLVIIGTKQLHGRLAEAILLLSQGELANENIFNHITRREFAELSAMSLESMLRLLNELKNDKIINIDKKQVLINDIELLKRLSRIG